MARKVDDLPGMQGVGYADDTCTLYVDVAKWIGGRPALYTDGQKQEGLLSAWKVFKHAYPEKKVVYIIARGL